MTVFKDTAGVTFRYDFWFHRRRFTGNTHQTTRTDALLVQANIKRTLRLRAGGLETLNPISPTFQQWAAVYFEHVRKRVSKIKRTDRVEVNLRVVMRFWGSRPGPRVTGKWAAVDGEPYHDLRLCDPVDDPMWLLKFEDWMVKRKIAGQTRNQYRSTLSQLYVLALHPAYRKRTSVMMNPFLGLPRDTGIERTSTVTVDGLRAWLQHASYHIRLAVAIAALAPKLRLANVLKLEWKKHFDADLRFITVHQHKTDATTQRPLVIPIDDQLRAILEDAHRRRRGSKHVITYRGRSIKSIRGGVKAAAEAAGITWGRFARDGVTFHTIRHTMATMLAELSDLDGAAPLSESVRKAAMGHNRLETTQRYTHIRPAVEQRALERLSKQTPIVDIVTLPWTRVTRAKPKNRRRAARVNIRGTSIFGATGSLGKHAKTAKTSRSAKS